jgi:LPXTG-motif cell wall-anchored protein
MKRYRLMLLAGLVALFGWGMAGSSALAQSNDLPIDAPDDCVENVMDLPALNVCKDAQGRHILNLPAIGSLREPATPAPASRGALPKTGLEVEDFAAIGMAAAAGGAVLLRRLRLAVS